MTITDMTVEMAIIERQKSPARYRDVTIDLEIIKKAINEMDIETCQMSASQLEDYLLNKIPFDVEIRQQGAQVLDLKVEFAIIPNEEDMDFIL